MLRDKPAAMLTVSPKGTVPVLVDVDGTVIDESLDIMTWALNRHDPAGWLECPHSPGTPASVLIGQCDGEFKAHLDGYKYPDRHPHGTPLDHRDAAIDFLERLDATLRQSPWLFGPSITLADIAIMPFVRQFAGVDPADFASRPWAGLQRWLASIGGSDLFARAMVRWPAWVPGQSPVVLGSGGQGS